MSGAAPLATEADRLALAEVLARPEFRDQRLDGLALRRWLLELWDRLVEALTTAEAERYASLGRLVYFAAAAVALALAWRAVRRRARRAAGPVAPRATAATTGTRPAGPTAEAAALALARGDPAGAVRAAFAAAAAALGRRWPGQGGEALTGPELAARAKDQGFSGLSALHERTVFGRQPAAEAEARSAVEVARRLEAATPAAGARR
ncbi:MAG: hypothetical protein IPO09_21465 [Anaeromyxobacter sp.]|nr:hypothetical protein [Anaeromyxobacter sp.]MBL0274670.1 hypothetical protein [Anaeromyxobacter sp.]